MKAILIICTLLLAHQAIGASSGISKGDACSDEPRADCGPAATCIWCGPAASGKCYPVAEKPPGCNSESYVDEDAPSGTYHGSK